MKEIANCSISNIYKLDGRVPIGKARDRFKFCVNVKN